MLSVSLERITLQANAYVELHAWLGAAGRDAVAAPPGLDAAADVYRAALANDDRDDRFRAATDALTRCSDDRCALAALERTPFRRAYARSLSTFAARWWSERATLVRAAIEIARRAFSGEVDVATETETEGLVRHVTRELGITWPDAPVVVDVVVDSPPAGNEAFVPAVLPVHGPCFARGGGGRVERARILDCVLVRALYPLRERSIAGAHLDQRAWERRVIGTVAAAIHAWEPRHVSPTLRSAEAVKDPQP